MTASSPPLGGVPSEYFVLTAQDARDLYFADTVLVDPAQLVHHRYRTNPKSLHDHLIGLLALRGTEEVLDLGCGNGALIEAVRPHVAAGHLVGLDISPAMLAAARNRLAGVATPCEWVEASAEHLGMFPDHSFDRVTAVYMAHYVHDLPQCFREVRRVLRPGGLFVLATDDPATMPEMWTAHYTALRALDAPDHLFRTTPKARISLLNGARQLAPHFTAVTEHQWQDQLQFAAVEPFLDFYRAHNYCCARSTPEGRRLPADFFTGLETHVGRTAQAAIDETGLFAVTKLTGAFLCQ